MGTEIESREAIKRVTAGDPIRAALMNTLIDFVNGTENPGFPYGYDDSTGTITRRVPGRRADLWLPATADDSADPFSIVEVYDSQLDDDMVMYLKVRKASASGIKMYAANEVNALVAGSSSWVKVITPYEYCSVNAAYGSSPAWLDQLGVSGFNVTTFNSGQLLCAGKKNSGGQVAVVSPTGSLILIGQTTVTHTKGTVQTVNVYRGSTKGLETFTSGDTVQAYNRFSTIAAAKWVAVAYINNGWELIAGEC